MLGKSLLLLALIALLGICAAWWATGAHPGWSKTRVQELVTDEITGLEYPVWQDRLVLGLDFLGAGLLGCAFLGGLGWFISHRSRTHPRIPAP